MSRHNLASNFTGRSKRHHRYSRSSEWDSCQTRFVIRQIPFAGR